ncbi:MAG: enoyl-CoA hydratase, partial [Acidimicrobiales bacterium]
MAHDHREDGVLVVERSGDGVATVTLNRPAQLNALTTELRAAVVSAFRSLGADDSIGAVILTGAGRAFCAGVDLKEIGGETRPSGHRSATVAAPPDLDMVGAIRACPAPVIAAVNGVAITGGFELALACDLIVAAATARFADTHARVGILPAWGLTQRLPRLIGINRAKELSFTGDFLDAPTAERWGLVNRVVEPDELLATCHDLGAEIAASDARAVRSLKRIYDDGADSTFADGLAVEAATSREHMRSVTPADIAARREAVQVRGRTQA